MEQESWKDIIECKVRHSDLADIGLFLLGISLTFCSLALLIGTIILLIQNIV